ncbi:MAG TPA: STAS-like domain-containing protein [Pyrinomonadaceae bacterium]|nr:STAS-like domain-containing protein [Pyrinomonadaceae bacterium]
MKLTVFDHVGANCVTYEDGQKVYDLIHPELQRGRPVELDFDGVRVLVSLFLNAAIGRLLEDISTGDLNRLLTISNLPPGGLETLKRVIENSNDYYHNPQVREALDRILAEHAAEI